MSASADIRRVFAVLVVATVAAGCGAGTAPLHPADVGVSGDPAVRTGRLTQDEVWSGAVIVTRELVVPRGRTLTIDPGTRVQFTAQVEPFSKIVVEGAFYAQGDFQENVFFSAEEASEEWNGVVVGADAVARLSYARFQLDARVHCQSSSVQFSFCHFSGSGQAAVIVDGAAPTIEDCVFQNNVAGVRCMQQASGEVLNNSFIGNIYGIVCDDGSQPTIARNVIANNRENGILCRGASSPEIQSNNILRNGRHAVRDGGRLIDNFIQGNNGTPPLATEVSLDPQSAQVFGVEEVVSARSSPVPEAGDRRFR